MMIWGPRQAFGVHFWLPVGGCGVQVRGLDMGSGLEVLGKGFGRAWVGPGAAGDPQMDSTWAQLESSWSQLGANMGPT